MKQVIVIRTDLNMRKGKMVAQGAHASLMAVINHASDNYVTTWLATGQTKICVGCDTLDELLELFRKAQQAKILHSLVRDAGKTEFNGVPTITAIAIGPYDDAEIDKITGHLKLL